MRAGQLLRPDADVGGERAEEEAARHDDAIQRAPAEDGVGVSGDRAAAVLHGDGGESGGEGSRSADRDRGERDVSAEGDSGAGEGAGDGHDSGDPGATRRRSGDGEEPAGAAPGVPGHGGAGAGAGGAAGRHREPGESSQLLREGRHPPAGGGEEASEEY